MYFLRARASHKDLRPRRNYSKWSVYITQGRTRPGTIRLCYIQPDKQRNETAGVQGAPGGKLSSTIQSADWLKHFFLFLFLFLLLPSTKVIKISASSKQKNRESVRGVCTGREWPRRRKIGAQRRKNKGRERPGDATRAKLIFRVRIHGPFPWIVCAKYNTPERY